MDQCELNSNNDNSQGGKHNVKQKKKITKTSTGSVVFLREGSIHKETAKCHDESSPTFPFFFLFFSISELLEKSFKNTHRKHSQRADKTPTRERSTDSEDDMKLSKQHSSSRSTGQHTGRVEMPVWNPFFFFFDHLPSCVSMETWRTLSSTWPGAGRNPTTQISA